MYYYRLQINWVFQKKIILSYLDANLISTGNFLPHLEGIEIQLAAECMVYMKQQTGHLNN
jgi:hypothetical protein